MKPLKGRHWIYTEFALEPTTITQSVYQYAQPEKCPSTGRIHYQGFLSFASPRYAHGVLNLFATRPHLEMCRDARRALAYCRKAESRCGPPLERGHCPLETVENDPAWWLELSDGQLWQNYPQWASKHAAGLRSYRCLEKGPTKPRPPPKVYVLWGASGTGKTAAILQKTTDFYTKGNPYWDGYSGQRIVVFDGVAADNVPPFTHLMRWLSCAPLMVPIKGGQTCLRASTFMFCSHSHYSEWWELGDLSPMEQRITRIFHFTRPVNEPDEARETFASEIHL
ncbi:replication protein [Gregarina niphandrodes]|uniref:ATP-dependent helicase Rep n=1 Tax=Gregarina niphandrodes TaxID=110365 RepID=A0A023B2V7_GRENI|nr:replication protein [Gregarina niphandrodes]EZG52129.1 replication protein [Gregarina niphandrodes]|eukprot:XP_011131904.1 replication protein [Gregarina niphandrodes]